jgi:hypothetical protein
LEVSFRRFDHLSDLGKVFVSLPKGGRTVDARLKEQSTDEKAQADVQLRFIKAKAYKEPVVLDRFIKWNGILLTYLRNIISIIYPK